MSKSLSSIYLILVALLIIAYSLGLSLSVFSFDQININSALENPSFEHWFGTDALGRDLLIRIVHGGRMSISIALLTALIAFFIGTTYGSIAGYVGNKVDEVMMRLIDLVYSLPDLLVLSIIALFLSRSTNGIIIGLAFINWMDVARLTRAEVQKFKREEFAEASRALGAKHWDIVTKHLLPNSIGSIIVALSFTIPRAILAESTLSFIGLGLSPPDTSWGTLVGDSWQYMRTDPHLIFFPALMIFLTVLTFNRLGDQLRDHFHPKKIGEHLLAK